MKKVIVLLMAVLLVSALVGCNVAPNVPRVTPYDGNAPYTNADPYDDAVPNYTGPGGVDNNRNGTNGTNRSVTKGTNGAYGGTGGDVNARVNGVKVPS